MEKKLLFGCFIFFTTIIFAGCSDSATGQKSEKAAKLNDSVLLFQEEYVTDDRESIGDLYFAKKGAEPEKIAGDVLNNHFVYYNSKDMVYFLNSEFELYEFTPGKDKKKLANDVSVFDGSGEVTAYQNEDMDLYIINGDENEKVASEVAQYTLFGNEIHYVDMDGNYKVYNRKDRQEKNIASDVSYFEILNRNGDIAYINEDSMLYFKEEKKDSVRISNDEASLVGFVDDQLLYLSGDDNDLYAANIQGKKEAKKIASEVQTVEVEKGKFYYINSDNNLFQIGYKDDQAKKLASDVYSFTLSGKDLYFMGKEQTLYKLSGDTKEIIASSVADYEISSEGEVTYSNDKHELFIGDTKVSSDVENYAFFDGTIVYSTNEDKLFMMNIKKDAEVLLDEMKSYSTAYYQNQLVYSNEMDFKDIAGVWKLQEDGDMFFIEIKEDGKFTELQDGESIQVEMILASFNSMDVNMDGESITITKNEDGTLTFDDGSDELYLTKSTKEEAEKYAADVVLREEMDQLDSLISDYLYEAVYAVNYGDPSSLSDYISVGSKFHDQQANYVVETYDKGITEELLDYTITDTRPIKDGVYEIVVQEEYTVYDVDGNSKYVNYESTYTVERVNGGLYIVDMKISNDAAAA